MISRYCAVAVVALCLCILLLLWNRQKRTEEAFEQEITNEQILTQSLTYQAKPTVFIHMYPEDRDVSLESISFITPLVRRSVRKLVRPAAGGHLTYVKAHEMATSSVDPRWRVLTTLKEPTHLFLFKPVATRIQDVEGLRGKRIGYIRTSDKVVYERFFETYGIGTDQVKWVHMSPDAIFKGLFENNECDVAAVLATKDSALLKEVQGYTFDWVPYESLNMTKMKAVFPYCRRGIFTMNSSRDGALSEPRTGTLLSIDTLLVGVPDAALSDTYAVILNSVNQPGKNSFYTQFFPFFKMTIQDVRAFSSQYKPTVESFAQQEDAGGTSDYDHRDEQVMFELTQPIKGHFRRVDKLRKQFMLPQDQINDVRLKTMDRVLLTKQPKEVENAYYYVAQVHDGWVVLADYMQLHLPASEFGDMQTDGKGQSTWLIPQGHSLKSMLYVDDRIWVPSLQRFGVAMPNPATESLRIEFAPALQKEVAKNDDSKGLCVEDGQYKTKALCEGTRTLLGQEKAAMTWDTPCQKDADCPYYRETDHRGGCVHGYCEMPMGVERKGYRLVEPAKTQPVCKGCPPDVSMTKCCDYTKDYMFE